MGTSVFGKKREKERRAMIGIIAVATPRYGIMYHTRGALPVLLVSCTSAPLRGRQLSGRKK